MPFDPHLLDALEASEIGTAAIGKVWRQILDPTSVMRPNQRGARWNPAGTEALYCSLDPATAAAEIDNLIASQSVTITRQRLTYAIDVHLTRVVDLRPDGWGAPFVYEYDVDDTETCRTIGAAVSWLGAGGLIVPSLRHAADNLVIFVANLDPDDHVTPCEPAYPHPPGPPSELDWSELEPAT